MRFQTKVLIIFILFFFAVVGMMLFFTIQSEQLIVNQVEADLRNIVHTVHVSTQSLSTQNSADRDALESFIKELKGNKAVREVSIVNSTQQIIASSNPKKVGTFRQLDGKEVIVKEQLGLADSLGPHNRYDIRIPIWRNNRIIGLVQTSIVVNDYRHLLQELQLRNIIIAGAVLLFSFFATALALRRINKPLHQLTFAAERIASGDLSIQLNDSTFNQADEIGRLTRSFNTMTLKLAAQKQLDDKLRSLERQAILSEMAANLAHEIRNPLNLINLTADHLGHEFKPTSESQQQIYSELIASLKTEVKHLNTMVGSFLNVGKPSKLKKNTFVLLDLFEQVHVLVKQHLLEKSITLNIQCAPELTITADLEQLRLVVLNLLLNAIEFVPQNGTITIDSHCSETPKECTFSIRDNGPGINPANAERIFEPYFSNRPGGTGLGLALAKRIIEEHSGTITATNHPDGGAQFMVSLPS
jgi:signal transduction histidine kinase